MKKKIILILIAIIIVIFVLKSLILSEEDRVKKDINSLKNSVEKEDKMGVLKYINGGYLDKNNITYEELITTMDELFEQADSIKILMSRMKIRIDSVNKVETIFASCSLGLKVFAKYEGEKVMVFGSIIKPRSARAYFKKSGEHYKIYSAEY